jgi:ABC-type uncharacterized transport system involved in gliding motility auxiliary subunit
MALKNPLAGGGGRKVLEGVNLLVYTLVGLAIIALANWFVSRHNHRWDLTPNKQYSLAPQTTKVLKDLNRDITIYAFDRERRFGEERDLLDKFSNASNRVTIRYVDPDRQPTLARSFQVRTYGTIVVAAGDRHFEAQGQTEEGVANALIRLLKGQKTVYFVQGHGERDIQSAERGGYEKIQKEFQNENYVVKTLVLLQTPKVPADCALLVIAGPRNDYLPPETEAIRKYVDGGGRVLFLLDPGVELPNLAALLAEWKVKVRNDLVIEQNEISQLFGGGPSVPVILKYDSSPIVQPLARTATLFPLTRSFEIDKEYKAGVSADPLCETSPDSFGVADFKPTMREVSYRPGKDIKGPLTVAVSGTTTGEGEKKVEGRFVALGTSSLAANNYLSFGGNRDLFMNAVNWLSADEDLISIRPKPPESQQLNLNPQQMRRIFYAGVLGLPLLIIVAGVTVWWRRR